MTSGRGHQPQISPALLQLQLCLEMNHQVYPHSTISGHSRPLHSPVAQLADQLLENSLMLVPSHLDKGVPALVEAVPRGPEAGASRIVRAASATQQVPLTVEHRDHTQFLIHHPMGLVHLKMAICNRHGSENHLVRELGVLQEQAQRWIVSGGVQTRPARPKLMPGMHPQPTRMGPVGDQQGAGTQVPHQRMVQARMGLPPTWPLLRFRVVVVLVAGTRGRRMTPLCQISHQCRVNLLQAAHSGRALQCRIKHWSPSPQILIPGHSSTQIPPLMGMAAG